MSILNEHELEKKIVSTIKYRIQEALAYRTYDSKTIEKLLETLKILTNSKGLCQNL